jgi:hypothetical protein
MNNSLTEDRASASYRSDKKFQEVLWRLNMGEKELYAAVRDDP